MKSFLCVVLAFLASISSAGQTNYMNVCLNCYETYNYFGIYDWDLSDEYLYFDSTLANNVWQIGVVDKPTFTSGFGTQGIALVTDTINPYPTNNVSSFQFRFINCSYYNYDYSCDMQYWHTEVRMQYRIDSDSGMDGGTIELSHDQGATWVNLIDDTDEMYVDEDDFYTTNDTVASLGRPGFSGTSEGWEQITLHFMPETEDEALDTILVRFTFASDSIQTNKDGWMIGLLQVAGIFSGIEEMQIDNLISIFPNPSNGKLFIQQAAISHSPHVQVRSSTGVVVFDDPNYSEEYIDTRNFSDGIYFLRYVADDRFSVKRFVVQH